MYDPTLPADHSDLVSAVMRSQLTGLKDLIDAILTITSAQIDNVTTGNPGDPASVGLSVVGNTLHFTFSLPRGFDGPMGPQGNAGTNGNDGAVGPQGPPFANAVVDATNTLNPGESATVGVNFDGSNVRFLFGIPRGNDGTPGMNGTNGIDGAPGEVTNAALASAISGTSSNSNGVATLDTAPSDPPTFADYEAMRAKMNELIVALRR